MSEDLFKKLSNILSSDDISNNEPIEQLQEKEEEQECKHLYITDGKNEICQNCGSEKQKPLSLEKEWRYFGSDNKTKDPSRCNLRKAPTKPPLTSQCEKVNIRSGKVVNDANQFYLDVTKGKIYRGKKRIAIIYACVYYSLKANNSSYSPDKLLHIFEIDRTTALRGLKFVKTNLSQKENHLLMLKTNTHTENLKDNDTIQNTTNETEIERLLDEIMEDLNATDSQIQEIKSLYKYLCGKSSLLNRSRPQSFATGLAKYYIMKKNPSFVFEIKYNVKLSNLTLKRIVNEIETIMN